MDDIILAKVATIERCLIRVREEYQKPWRSNFTVQDALLMNLERVCQATIDLASHIVRLRNLGVPKQSREVFEMLLDAEIVPQDMAASLIRMVGFRNIAVHNYTSLNLNVVDHYRLYGIGCNCGVFEPCFKIRELEYLSI